MDSISHVKDYAELLHELNAEGVDYLVVGAHAVGYHGYIRSSDDFDVWIRRSAENAAKVYRALARFGAPMNMVRVEDFLSDDLIFQIGTKPFRIDIITSVSGLDFDEAWGRRESSTYLGEPNFVPGLQDLLANKTSAGREKDLLDVKKAQADQPRGARDAVRSSASRSGASPALSAPGRFSAPRAHASVSRTVSRTGLI